MRFQEVINKLKSNRSMDDGGVQINLTPFRDLEVAATEKKFNEFIDALSSCSNLTSFIVQGHDLFSELMARSQHALLDDVASTKGGRFEQIAGALQNKVFLRELVINHVTVNSGALNNFVQCFGSLRTLDLSGVHLGNREAFSVLYEGLKSSRKIENFRYVGHAFSDDNFHKLMQLFNDGNVVEERNTGTPLLRVRIKIAAARDACKSEEHVCLNIVAMELDSKCVQELIKTIKPSDCVVSGVMHEIDSLNLSGSKISDDDLMKVLDALSSGSKLRVLDLREIKLSKKVCNKLLKVYDSSNSLRLIFLDESLLNHTSGKQTAFGAKFAEAYSRKSALYTGARSEFGIFFRAQDDSSLALSPQVKRVGSKKRAASLTGFPRSASCFAFGGKSDGQSSPRWVDNQTSQIGKKLAEVQENKESLGEEACPPIRK